ncbi:serine hydrolase [Paenibacillus sp. GP183]|uniref:serine hydrolase n=1 Tax=Paenibacillus sp. GP183 TaxID=1882751 RepID=UPI000B8552A8|nr:serine hydrolase [Paenibacillus sp. GP183]
MDSKQFNEQLPYRYDLMSEPQARIQTLLDELVHSGTEKGLQVAVYLDGKLVIDAWAGIADDTTKQPVTGIRFLPFTHQVKGLFQPSFIN